jgi:cell division protein FtsI/penicillin-binding protein 2
MTIGAIILDIFLFIILIFICVGVLCNSYDNEIRNVIITALIGIIVLGGVIIFQLYYYKNFESGKRAIKTQESNLKGGINREIKVYDINGKEIETFKGKFDIEYDDDRILFDDENGNRHIIYYPTGTVIINETKGE